MGSRESTYKRITNVINRKFKWSVDVCDVCIFNKAGSQNFVDILSEYNYFILDVEGVFYIKHFIFSISKSFKLGSILSSLSNNYYSSIINAMNPMLVITFIDNDRVFWRLDKEYNEYIIFITVQNGTRFFSSSNEQESYLKHLFYYPEEDIYHSNFVCISDYEVDLYKKNGAIVEQFYPIGVLNASNYIENYIDRENIFELCLVANSINDRPVNLKIMEYFFRYVDKYDISACVALKKSYLSDDFIEYIRIFDQYYGNTSILLIANNELGVNEDDKKNRMNTNNPISSSQYLSDVSNVTIGFVSTLLRQTFSRGNKIYPINYENNDLDTPFNLLGIDLRPEYDSFEKHLNELRLMEDNAYYKKNKTLMGHLDIFNMEETPNNKLKNIINGFLKFPMGDKH